MRTGESPVPIDKSQSGLFRSRNLLIIILIIASSMRFIGLGHKSLWVDEVVSSYISAGEDLKLGPNNLSFIYWQRYNDVTPPLREYIAHYCFKLFGVNEASLRLFPAIFGVLGIWLIYLIVKKWFDVKIAVIAAFLMTFSPFDLSHSQDGRMYTVIMFCSLAGFYCLYKSLFSEKKRFYYWMGFTIWNTFNIYLSYFGFWALISQIIIAMVWIFWDGFREDKPWVAIGKTIGKLIVSLSFMLNLYIPWFYATWGFIMRNIHSPIPYQSLFTTEKVSYILARDYVYYLKPDWHFIKSLLIDFGLPGYGMYLYLIFFFMGVYTAWQFHKKIVVGLMLWLIVPLLIAFAPPAKVLFFNRYISFMLPVYLILIAVGIWTFAESLWHYVEKISPSFKASVICFCILIVCFFLNLIPIMEYYRYEKQNWRDAVNYMLPQLKLGDIIVAGPYNALWCVLYYAQQNGADPNPIAKSKLGGDWSLVYLHGKTFAMGERLSQIEELENLCAKFPRIWYVSAYYRTYQYRPRAYYDFIESQFPTVKQFPAKDADDTVYVFFHEDPGVKPDPTIIWPTKK